MSARILEGSPIAERVKADLRAQLEQMAGPPPKLVALLVGDDPRARAHAQMQAEACEEVGIRHELREFAEQTTDADMLEVIQQLNADEAVSGIRVLLPVPAHLDAARLQGAIAPEKDVEGVTPANLGAALQDREALAPCTAQAVMALVEASVVDVEDAEAVVVSHSELAGMQTALLLLDRLAGATVCHTATRDVPFHTRRVEVLVVDVGKPGLIKAHHIKPGAVVIDLGMNRVWDPKTGESRMVGDVLFEEAVGVAGAITPVPGGVAPVTTAMVLKNALEAAELQRLRRLGCHSTPTPMAAVGGWGPVSRVGKASED